MGKWGNGEMGKWGDHFVRVAGGSGEVGKWGNCLITLLPQNPITLSPPDDRLPITNN
ncbi:MAG: hypothetical protein IM579_18060 [Microcystis sp. M62BS1]|nr:hypothetical protein [Microcystis sp. M62BS1]